MLREPAESIKAMNESDIAFSPVHTGTEAIFLTARFHSLPLSPYISNWGIIPTSACELFTENTFRLSKIRSVIGAQFRFRYMFEQFPGICS